MRMSLSSSVASRGGVGVVRSKIQEGETTLVLKVNAGFKGNNHPSRALQVHKEKEEGLQHLKRQYRSKRDAASQLQGPTSFESDRIPRARPSEPLWSLAWGCKKSHHKQRITIERSRSSAVALSERPATYPRQDSHRDMLMKRSLVWCMLWYVYPIQFFTNMGSS